MSDLGSVVWSLSLSCPSQHLSLCLELPPHSLNMCNSTSISPFLQEAHQCQDKVYLMLKEKGQEGSLGSHFFCSFCFSSVSEDVKNQPAMQETQVRPLSREDALEKGMATHSSILARRNPWTEEPGRHSPLYHKESDRTEQLTLQLYYVQRGTWELIAW